MSRVIIFGQRDYAQQAHYYLREDSPHEVVAFSVTGDQCASDEVFGLPLVPFEEVEERYPPGEHSFFVPMSGRSMNRLRERFYREAKAKGYPLVSYVSSHATVCGEVGENCFILEQSTVQPFVRVGDDVTIWCHTHIGHHSYIASRSLVEAGVTLAEGSLVGNASVVTRDTDPWSIYTGNPARKRKVDSREFEFL